MARLLLALSLMVSVALPAKAMDSIGMIVAETGIGCVRFVVATDAGYSLLMWDGGATRPWEGDIIEGPLHQIGYVRINVPGIGEMDVFVEDHSADLARAADFFYNSCPVDG